MGSSAGDGARWTGLPAARPGPGPGPVRGEALTSSPRREAPCRSPASARRRRGTGPTGGAAGAAAPSGPVPTRGRAPGRAQRPGCEKGWRPPATGQRRDWGPAPPARLPPGACLLRRAGRVLPHPRTPAHSLPGQRGSGCAGLDGNW